MIRRIAVFALVIISFVFGYIFQLVSVPPASSDPFPFWDDTQQYVWYDRNDRPMAVRCYTTMSPPCSPAGWKRAFGVVALSTNEERALNEVWCKEYASLHGMTQEQCLERDEKNFPSKDSSI